MVMPTVQKRRIQYEGLRLSNQTLYLSWGYEDLEQLASEPPPLMLTYAENPKSPIISVEVVANGPQPNEYL
jgi:hypothetical protein